MILLNISLFHRFFPFFPFVVLQEKNIFIHYYFIFVRIWNKKAFHIKKIIVQTQRVHSGLCGENETKVEKNNKTRAKPARNVPYRIN